MHEIQAVDRSLSFAIFLNVLVTFVFSLSTEIQNVEDMSKIEN